MSLVTGQAFAQANDGVLYMQPEKVASPADVAAEQALEAQQIQEAQAAWAAQQAQQQAEQQAAVSAFGSMFGGGGAGTPAKTTTLKNGQKITTPGTPATPAAANNTPLNPNSSDYNPDTSSPIPKNNGCSVVLDCKAHTISVTETGGGSGKPITDKADCGKEDSPTYNSPPGKPGQIGRPMHDAFIPTKSDPTSSQTHPEIDIQGIPGMGVCGGDINAKGFNESKVLHPVSSGVHGANTTNGCPHISQNIMNALVSSCIGASLTITGATDAPAGATCNVAKQAGAHYDNGGTPSDAAQ